MYTQECSKSERSDLHANACALARISIIINDRRGLRNRSIFRDKDGRFICMHNPDLSRTYPLYLFPFSFLLADDVRDVHVRVHVHVHVRLIVGVDRCGLRPCRRAPRRPWNCLLPLVSSGHLIHDK